MSEPVTLHGVPEVVEQEWKGWSEHALPYGGGGEMVGALRLAFLAGAWTGHANHDAIEEHHRKPQPDKPPANASRVRETEAYREGYEDRMSKEVRLRGWDDADADAKAAREGRVV